MARLDVTPRRAHFSLPLALPRLLLRRKVDETVFSLFSLRKNTPARTTEKRL
jgi:hypothetical protein